MPVTSKNRWSATATGSPDWGGRLPGCRAARTVEMIELLDADPSVFGGIDGDTRHVAAAATASRGRRGWCPRPLRRSRSSPPLRCWSSGSRGSTTFRSDLRSRDRARGADAHRTTGVRRSTRRTDIGEPWRRPPKFPAPSRTPADTVSRRRMRSLPPRAGHQRPMGRLLRRRQSVVSRAGTAASRPSRSPCKGLPANSPPQSATNWQNGVRSAGRADVHGRHLGDVASRHAWPSPKSSRSATVRRR